MLCLPQFRGRAVDLRSRVDQLIGIQYIAASIALIATCAFVAANIAGAFDISVGKKATLMMARTTVAAGRCIDNHFGSMPGRSIETL